MGKPSITNIKPPSQTTVWTPSTSTWDLNNSTDWAEFKAHGWGADKIDGSAFTSLTDKLNVTEASAITVTHDDLQGYDYVFYGVNGGSDETIIGKLNAAGILVSGNGKDHITGGSLGDQIWAGNGADVVHGGGGNDIIFGENGADQLFGDSDNGVATVTPGGSTLVLKPGVTEFPGALSSLPQNSTNSSQPTDKDLSTEQFLLEGGKLYQVFDVKLSDAPPTGDVGLTTDVTIVVYGGGVGNIDHTDILSFDNTVKLDDGVHTQFAVEVQDGAAWTNAKVYLFLGHLDANDPRLDDPGHSAQINAAPLANFDDIVTTQPGEPLLSAFSAGDQLIGGNGPDTFTWDAADHNNVDLIWDYNSGSGTYDPTEGDKLVLKGVTLTDTNNDQVLDKHDLMTFSNVDLDGGGNTGLVVYVADNQAIGLVGITDINQVDITFA